MKTMISSFKIQLTICGCFLLFTTGISEAQKCQQPKRLSECGSCTPTCDNLHPVCTAICAEGCDCPKTMIETSSLDATCMLATNCPGANCTGNSTRVNCSTSPCSNSSCPRFPSAVCHDDTCDGCFARYFYSGSEVTQQCSGARRVTVTLGLSGCLIPIAVMIRNFDALIISNKLLV